MTPLYNHIDEASAYNVSDYPYSFKLRTSIKFWLEKKDSKGFRFCSRTINPKNGRVNAVKTSTYSEFAGCLFLDEEGHCKWSGLGQYSSAEEIRSFIERFPDADYSLLRPFLALKVAHTRRYADDKIRITINGKSEAPSESELEDRKKELAILVRAQEALNQAARG